MGLFSGGGFFGSGGKSSSTTNTTQVQETQIGVSDIEGVGIGQAGGNVEVVTISTDQGAIDAARSLAIEGLDAARDFSAEAAGVSRAGLDVATDISAAAIDLGRSGFESGEQVAFAGLDNARAAQEGAFSFAGDVITSALDTTGQASDRIAKFSYDVLDANTSLSREALASQSSLAGRAIDAVSDAGANVLDFAAGLFTEATEAQAQLTDQNLSGLTSLAHQTSASADDRVQKVALYAFIALVAALVLPRLIKGGAM